MAAKAQLVLDLVANDKTKSGFDSMGANAEGATNKVAQVGDAARAILGGVVATKALEFGNDAIQQASDLSETINKSSIIFGENADEVEAWASNAARQVGLAKGPALEAAASFGNMFQQIGFAGDQATDMSQDVVQLAADLGSFNNLGTDQVMDMLSASFRGEYDSLQRLIPNINAARVEQEALAATGKTTTAELTAAEKATAVLAIVQKDGAAAANDFAETSDGLANKQKIASASLTDLKGTIGDVLLPVMDAATSAGLALTDWMNENPTAAKIVVIGLGALAVALGIAAVAQWAMNSALLASPITWVVLAIVALIAIIALLVANWDTVREAGAAAWDWIKGAWSSAVDWFRGVGDGIKKIFTDAWQGIQDTFRGVGDFFGRIADTIREAFRGAFNRIAGFWNSSVGSLSWTAPSWVPFIGGNTISVPRIPLLADGGTITRAGLALVGERGAEVVELNAGDRVWPNGTGPGKYGAVSIGVLKTGADPAEIFDELDWRTRQG